MKNGFGKIVWVNGDYYEGQFKDNYFQGNGCFENIEKKIKYSGEWKHGQKHGKGILNEDEKVYEGNFANDLKEGPGILKLPNKKIISGHWKAN